MTDGDPVFGPQRDTRKRYRVVIEETRRMTYLIYADGESDAKDEAQRLYDNDIMPYDSQIESAAIRKCEVIE